MLINSVVLVLREVLEAAMVVSVLLALSRNLRLPASWLFWSLPVIAIAVVAFASTLDTITDAFDGAGQELVSAALQIAVFVGIVAVVFWVASEDSRRDGDQRLLQWLLALTVVCALVRECSEIVIYITAFAAASETRAAVFAGSAIGAGIGISLGVLLFASLRAVPLVLSTSLCIALMALIGAGMVMQSTMLLEQVDWLQPGMQLWDSSALVSEQSISGQLLYAVFGYEATPGRVQVLLYLASVILVAGAWWLPRHYGGKHYGD
ncbi:hypothetical protein DWB85_07610 [Seongchinamella sediminis]|uniref:Iron permease FTR1 n=1 Tax=Seongchinamella sediminis TaxID=2283635 RepID=A0A3L7DY10_9GAMM|nr:FTR1 family protein [Seongchinamella sediminis]RLQ22478.1 hypothetical protein DWB85_07610 [Seongchinamella sediminis]